MNVHVPFCDNGNARWDEAYKNEKNTLSGVYPLVIFNMWHTGIHLSNKDKHRIKDNFLKPMVEGELIAYKLASDYDVLPLSPSEIKMLENNEITGPMENAREHYPELYREIASITGQSDASVADVIRYIKNNREESIDRKKGELSKAVTPFSTSFILTKHTITLIDKKTITYFILYSNLAPISDYTPEREVYRTFFRKWFLKDAEQLAVTSVAKLNLYTDAGCANKSGKHIGANGQLTLYKGVYGGTDLYGGETYKYKVDNAVYYVKNTQIAGSDSKLIKDVSYATGFKLQPLKSIPLYYDKERKYLKCTIKSNDKITLELKENSAAGGFNKLVNENNEMKEQEKLLLITFDKNGYENERTHSVYFNTGNVYVKKAELESSKKQIKGSSEFYYDKDIPLQIYEKTADKNGEEQFIEKTCNNDKVYLHRYDGFVYTGEMAETATYIGIRRTRSSSNYKEEQEEGYLGEASAKARDILEAIYNARVALPAAFSGNAQLKPELTVENGFPVYNNRNGATVKQIVFTSELNNGNWKLEILDKEKQSNNIYEIKFEKNPNELFIWYAKIKPNADIKHTIAPGYETDSVQTCNKDTAELGCIGMQGFIYDNGVHIELFTPSLNQFKTNSRDINDDDLENEIYFIAKKNAENRIPIHTCNTGELFFEEPQAAYGMTPVIIVYQTGNNWIQNVHISGGYSKCQFGEIIKTDIWLTSEKKGYKFTVCGNTYHLKEVNMSVEPCVPKENISNRQFYVSLASRSPEYVDIDGKGWLRKNEVYLIERPIVISAIGTPPQPFKTPIRILKRKLTETPSWYAFDEDLIDCKKETLLTIMGTNPRYELQTWKGHPVHEYKTDIKRWIINPRENPFTEDVRVKFRETVRTGTKKDDIVRIKHNDAYYFFKNEDVVRMYLRNNVEEQRETALLQYHILGLPFFSLMEDTNTDLKCDVEALNRKVEPVAKSSGVKDRADYQNPETFARGIYSEEGLYKTLNTLIIHCPSFWEEKEDIKLSDYGLHTNLVKYKEYIKKRLWMSGAVKRHMGVSGVKEFYYFHPINFLRYVCSEFVMEFNPYFGEHKDTDKNLFVCKSNPGFAPVSAGNTEYKHDGVSYAVCTSLFNAKRDVGSGNPHGGVDLAPGGAGKEIKSLIYGEVWACTYDKDVVNTYNSSPQDIICFGKVMIIKGSDNKLYLLAHLDDYKKEVGAFVSPGDTVAICGTTGYSTGFHLHLEVILCEETDKKKVLDKNGNNKSKSEGTGLKWAEDYSNRYPFLRNPFNHDDPYKGQ